MIGRLAKSKAFWLAAAGTLALLLYLAFAVFGVQAAFVDREVNESFPTTTEARGATQESTGENPDTASTSDPPAETGGEDTQEPAQEASGPVRVLAGTFHDAEYEGSGEANVYRQADGSYVLRLVNLNVDNGPDLFVYGVAADDAFDSATVEQAGFVDAGPLKGNQGNQTYELPASFDPEAHRAITIWCQRFSGNFATAPLGPVS